MSIYSVPCKALYKVQSGDYVPIIRSGFLCLPRKFEIKNSVWPLADAFGVQLLLWQLSCALAVGERILEDIGSAQVRFGER